jgi:carbamoyl-phosphate synthase large subunit
LPILLNALRPAAPVTGRAQAIADSFSIRRTALVRDVTNYPAIAAAAVYAAVDALRSLETGHLEVAPLQVYFKAST